jgi:hypothetical protein
LSGPALHVRITAQSAETALKGPFEHVMAQSPSIEIQYDFLRYSPDVKP